MAAGSEAVIDTSRGVAPATWVPADERDAFISWLRGEFAAANAIIDALCHHLQTLAASPGEYDSVLSSIHQRRYNWNPVLHMQQYYSVAEVLFSLQQVAYKKQQQLVANSEEPKLDTTTKPGEDGASGNKVEDKESSGDGSDNEEQRPAAAGGACYSNGSTRKHLAEISVSKKGTSEEETAGVQSIQSSPRSYTGLEEVDGEQVNVLDGLEVHENVFETEEALRIAALVTESHAAKKKTGNKSGAAGNKLRTSKVKPKEVIQFGTIPSNILGGDSAQPAPVFTEETAEPMPAYLESIIDHLVKSHIVPASKRPDSCSISVLEPGDYMPPHKHSSLEQPLYILSLGSQSEVTFGRNMKTNTGGETNEKYKVALPVGSVLVLQGNSAQMVQCAVPSMQSTRLLVTFGKMAKRTLKPLPTSPVASTTTSPVSPTALNVNGHSFVPARLQTPPVPVVVPVRTPVVQAQVLPTQPMIVASIAPYTPVTVVSPGWSTTPPARVPSPGTGVFLPAKGTSVYNSNNHNHHNHNHQHHMNGSHRRHAAAHHFHNATTTTSNGHVVAEKEVAA